MFIIYSNLFERLLGAQLTNVAVPIMNPIGKCIGNIVSKEIIDFFCFVCILTYLLMKACKHGAIVPAFETWS